MSNYIWLFGENLGKTANNNSYYFWKQINNIEDGIDKYIVLEKNKKNKEVYKKLTSNEQERVLWKNSYRHIKYYKNADMLFVTLSYQDVKPDKFIKKFKNVGVSAPTVYLQHGTTGMKKLGYKGNSYWNSMFRFIYYNPNMKNIFISENDFRKYQLKYGVYHPRYVEMIKRYEEYKLEKKANNEKSILWFITWREYFGNNEETKEFLKKMESTLSNNMFIDFMKKNNYKLKICLHQFFDKKKIKILKKKLEGLLIEIVTPKEIDVMDEIVKNDILITDYSSLAYDFTFLNKKVILYQPDFSTYSEYRKFYNEEEIKKNAVTNIEDLIKEFKKDNKENNFLRSAFPQDIDYDYVRNGEHIKGLYDYFSVIQKNDITFIGYNFYGKGGSVSATKALAEALLEKEKLVKFITLKRHIKLKNGKFPYGLNVKSFYYSSGNSKKTRLKSYLYPNRKKTAFRFDPQKEYLLPYIEVALEKKLDQIHSHTVVSTRESLHPYLENAKSSFIKKKIYFFHTDYKVLQEQFKGLIDYLKTKRLSNVAFVTENSRENYEKFLDYTEYDNSTIIPNCLESNFIINRNEIEPIGKSKHIKAVYLLRISNDRKKDIENLLNFAKYLKEKKSNIVEIDVYGNGDYLERFKELIIENELNEYVKYAGATSNIKMTLKQYDCVIDFSLNHSFGMTYMEAIMNGKMLFAMKNQGSVVVLKEMPYCYIESYEDLLHKLKRLYKITVDDLRNNYDIINEKYSHEKIAKKFIDFIEESKNEEKNN